MGDRTWDGKADNDFGAYPRDTQGAPVWPGFRANGDIDVKREQLVEVAAKLRADLDRLKSDIAYFRSSDLASVATLGISSAAGTFRRSAGQTHEALLTALGRLETAYEKVIDALRGTEGNYDQAEENAERGFR